MFPAAAGELLLLQLCCIQSPLLLLEFLLSWPSASLLFIRSEPQAAMWRVLVAKRRGGLQVAAAPTHASDRRPLGVLERREHDSDRLTPAAVFVFFYPLFLFTLLFEWSETSTEMRGLTVYEVEKKKKDLSVKKDKRFLYILWDMLWETRPEALQTSSSQHKASHDQLQLTQVLITPQTHLKPRNNPRPHPTLLYMVIYCVFNLKDYSTLLKLIFLVLS